MQKAGQHVPVLDAIRGLAILLVLLIHIGESLPSLPNNGWKVFGSLASSSWVGVDLFFVLSGFLITGILYDTRGATNFFRIFYARRFLRIFPLYYGFLFLLWTLTIPLHIEWKGREWIYMLYLQNTHIVRNVQSATFSPYFKIDHLWSLAVEEQFYCLWPALVFLVKDRSRLIKMTVALMIASMLVRLLMLYSGKSLWMIYIFTPARADSLMMGSVLALLFRSGVELQQQLKRWAAFVLPASLVVLVILALPAQGLSFSSKNVICFGYTTIALASASLMTLSLTSRRFGTVINRPALRWLGKYSYGIYIIHLPAMMLLLHLHVVTQFEQLYPSPFWKLLVIVMTVAFALGLAFLSFSLYESRFLRLKRFFRYEFPEKTANSGDVASVVLTCSPQSAQNSA
jgi:peptidoglycan/LPS O-acetylase OafA/YrhL